MLKNRYYNMGIIRKERLMELDKAMETHITTRRKSSRLCCPSPIDLDINDITNNQSCKEHLTLFLVVINSLLCSLCDLDMSLVVMSQSDVRDYSVREDLIRRRGIVSIRDVGEVSINLSINICCKFCLAKVNLHS